MAYEGEQLNACGIVRVDFNEAFAVAVSGSGPNVCGHLLFFTPASGGYYFHVAGELRGYPRYMDEAGYKRYLRENNKTELKRVRVDLPNPDGATLFIEDTLAEKWTWLVLPHNCVTFVEGVISAGGGNWSSGSNCPRLATTATVAEQTQQFFLKMKFGAFSGGSM